MKTKNFYFTFGFGQVHAGCFIVIAAKDYGEARERMFDKFGKKCAFQYSEDQWFNSDGISQQEEYKLKEIR